MCSKTRAIDKRDGFDNVTMISIAENKIAQPCLHVDRETRRPPSVYRETQRAVTRGLGNAQRSDFASTVTEGILLILHERKSSIPKRRGAMFMTFTQSEMTQLILDEPSGDTLRSCSAHEVLPAFNARSSAVFPFELSAATSTSLLWRSSATTL